MFFIPLCQTLLRVLSAQSHQHIVHERQFDHLPISGASCARLHQGALRHLLVGCLRELVKQSCSLPLDQHLCLPGIQGSK